MKALIGFGILLAGAATLLILGNGVWLDLLRSEDALLRGRLEGYWQARKAGDGEALAQYTHPLHAGEAPPSPSSILVTESYEIQQIDIDGDAAIATVKLRSRVTSPRLSSRTRETSVKSKWVRYQKKWYREVGPGNSFQDMLREIQRQRHPEAVPHEALPAPEGQPGEKRRVSEEL